VCKNCGQGCRDRRAKRGLVPTLAARPWIWVVLGYLAFIGALSAMVVIAVKHQQPDVLVQKHGR
jgi:hypothetical protein